MSLTAYESIEIAEQLKDDLAQSKCIQAAALENVIKLAKKELERGE